MQHKLYYNYLYNNQRKKIKTCGAATTFKKIMSINQSNSTFTLFDDKKV